MSGTDLAYGGTSSYAMCGTDLAYGGTSSYAMSGTDLAYVAPGLHQVSPVGRQQGSVLRVPRGARHH
eukprot:97030-Rhodomonas_salina.1